MDSRELMIGNYVKDPYNKVVRLVSVVEDASMLRPIVLTEEWLLEFGFTDYEWCTDCAFIKLNDTHMMLRYYSDKWYCTKRKVTKDKEGHKTSEGKDIVKDGFIKYVHQVQNLYRALCGEELIKQKQ